MVTTLIIPSGSHPSSIVAIEHQIIEIGVPVEAGTLDGSGWIDQLE